MEKLDVTQADQDREIAQLAQETTNVQKDMLLKMNKSDATSIWNYFQRFAEYNDLKDLYNKVIPELAKFEQKMANYEKEAKVQQLIIARFDENISQKSSKTQISVLYDYIKKNCATNDEAAGSREAINKSIIH